MVTRLCAQVCRRKRTLVFDWFHRLDKVARIHIATSRQVHVFNPDCFISKVGQGLLVIADGESPRL